MKTMLLAVVVAGFLTGCSTIIAVADVAVSTTIYTTKTVAGAIVP